MGEANRKFGLLPSDMSWVCACVVDIDCHWEKSLPSSLNSWAEASAVLSAIEARLIRDEGRHQVLILTGCKKCWFRRFKEVMWCYGHLGNWLSWYKRSFGC